MKKSIAIILCWFAGHSLSAQNLQVLVQDPQGALPYAVVSVNHRQHYLCDSLGSALLPSETLKAGDTLSSSYIGKRPVFALYNPEADGPCILTHEAEEAYEIENVTVVAEKENGRKAFRKYVKAYPHLAFDCLLTGGFQAEITPSGDTSRNVTGSFSLANRIPRNKGQKTHAKYYFNLPPEFQTSDDTTGIGPALSESLRTTVRLSNQIIGRIFMESLRRGAYTDMHYLGIKKNQHIFRFVYADRNEVSFRILFRVNRQSRQIEQLNYSRVQASGNQKRQWDIEIQCVLLESGQRGALSVLSVPQDIRSIYSREDGTRYELTLSGISYEIRTRY